MPAECSSWLPWFVFRASHHHLFLGLEVANHPLYQSQCLRHLRHTRSQNLPRRFPRHCSRYHLPMPPPPCILGDVGALPGAAVAVELRIRGGVLSRDTGVDAAAAAAAAANAVGVGWGRVGHLALSGTVIGAWQLPDGRGRIGGRSYGDGVKNKTSQPAQSFQRGMCMISYVSLVSPR